MSYYTLTLKDVVESLAGYQDNLGLEEKIEIARKEIFNFEYPIPDDDKARVENLFILNYMDNELNYGTFGHWKMRLIANMRMKMPYYNEMYKASKLEFDPFCNTDFTEDSDGDTKGVENAVNKSTGNSVTDSTDNLDKTVDATQKVGMTGKENGNVKIDTNSTDTSSGNSEKLSSDTPQYNYGGNDYANQLSTDKTSGKVTHDGTSNEVNTLTKNEDTDTTGKTHEVNTDKHNTTTNTEANSNDDITKADDYRNHLKSYGNKGMLTSDMYLRYLDTIRNIDQMVIEDLRCVFLVVG